MNELEFIEPVPVISGLGVVQMIASVGEAYAFLSDMPGRSRNADHEVALLACRAALKGDIEPDTAYAIFRTFAHRCGILAPDLAPAIAAQGARSDSSGPVRLQ